MFAIWSSSQVHIPTGFHSDNVRNIYRNHILFRAGKNSDHYILILCTCSITYIRTEHVSISVVYFFWQHIILPYSLVTHAHFIRRHESYQWSQRSRLDLAWMVGPSNPAFSLVVVDHNAILHGDGWKSSRETRISSMIQRVLVQEMKQCASKIHTTK